MTKLQFITFCFSITIVLSISVLVLIDVLDTLWMIFSILIIIPNKMLATKRVNQNKALQSIIVDECDPIKYIQELEKFEKNSVRGELKKILDDINKSSILIEGGQFDEGKEILMKYIDVEDKLSFVTRYTYYKAWFMYYLYKEENTIRLKVLLEQIKTIIDSVKEKYKLFLQSNYNVLKAQLEICEGINLEVNKNNFLSALKQAEGKRLILVTIWYNVGLIEYKLNNYKEAYKKFISVINNGNKLYMKNKANEYVELIKAKIPVEDN